MKRLLPVVAVAFGACPAGFGSFLDLGGGMSPVLGSWLTASLTAGCCVSETTSSWRGGTLEVDPARLLCADVVLPRTGAVVVPG